MAGKSIKDVEKLARGLKKAAEASRRILVPPAHAPAAGIGASPALQLRRIGL